MPSAHYYCSTIMEHDQEIYNRDIIPLYHFNEMRCNFCKIQGCELSLPCCCYQQQNIVPMKPSI